MSKFDDFADEVEATSGHAGLRGCGFAEFVSELPGEDADKVQSVMANRAVSARAISEALRKRVGSAAPSAYVIAAHRRRDCHCHRELK